MFIGNTLYIVEGWYRAKYLTKIILTSNLTEFEVQGFLNLLKGQEIIAKYGVLSLRQIRNPSQLRESKRTAFAQQV